MLNTKDTKRLVTISILSALGTILMLIEIPSPTPWLKFDLSDVVVYLGAMIYGPVGAIIVAFIKSLIHFFLKGSLVGVPIDQFTAFLSSLSYALPLYYLTKLLKGKNNKFVKRILPLIICTLIMTIIMTSANFFITDLYVRLMITNDITKIGQVTHAEVIDAIANFLGFSLPTWITSSSFLPKGFFFWFIIITYIPFNLIKASLLSALFLMLSYRLDFVIKRYEIGNEDDCILLQIK